MIVVVYEAAPGSHVDDLFLAYHVTEISVNVIYEVLPKNSGNLTIKKCFLP